MIDESPEERKKALKLGQIPKECLVSFSNDSIGEFLKAPKRAPIIKLQSAELDDDGLGALARTTSML